MFQLLIRLLAVLVLATGGIAVAQRGSPGGGGPILDPSLEPIQPLPLAVDEDPEKVKLGRRLFLDPRLSRDNTISCATCHPLGNAGVDGLPYSRGIGGAQGNINAPTVYNSRFNIAQFWDGRAASLEEQIEGPIHNPLEMGSNWPEVLEKLSRDTVYQRSFHRLYGGITSQAIKDAIATFERSLITPNARFDRYLRGEEAALTEEERQGYTLFKSYGCASCHQGRAAGGNMYEKMGLMDDYFGERGNVGVADYGRFNVTGEEEERFEFKVPSLRNVALTAPYFHDGSAATLSEAVDIMARYQLGRPMPSRDRDLIVAFLKSLTGDFSAGQQ